MSRIVEFLEARLVEDEVMAHEAAQHLSGIWTFDNGEADARRQELAKGGRFGAHPSVGGITSGCRYNAESEMKHIARHDPARVLREVSAKRIVMATIRRRIEQGWGYHYNEDMLADDLAPLVIVYSDHPDYQHEWSYRN
ncbi:DUF6221 family protein [Rhodococcus erythropolis]|uniref:DUF6221 family protein n=1 Tax=Rhodococcus erythropolis TaxID=1833 RepID=UPI0036719595